MSGKLLMDLRNVKDAFDHVTKKQMSYSSKSHQAIEQISQEIEYAVMQLQLTSYPDRESLLCDLKTKLKEISPLAQLETTQKELNVALNKYPKQLEKSFNPDISKAYRKIDFDSHIINHIIASHLYREGLFYAGDMFANESGQQDTITMKSPFIEMYDILQALKSHNLEPALKWTAYNQEKLSQSGSDLELKLHQLRFVDILQNGDRKDALNYAKTHFPAFHSSHMVEIQKLMMCLLWAGKVDSSPYSDLLSPVHWEKLPEEFIGQFCNLLGQSFESPLSITVGAGVQGLPTLLKLMNVMTGRKQEWQSMKQLPVPVDLGKEFQFHTVFVCPVSRDRATEENPPMMMSCGHVLCKQSIMKLSKSSTKAFKCPYCPTEVDASHCKELFF